MRSQFEAEMVATVRREIPEELDWLALGQLPPLRWQDDRTTVDAVVQRGWLAAAFLRGAPQASPELRQQARLFEPTDVAAFGQWLLKAWMAHDTHSPELTDTRRDELRIIAEQAAQLAERLGRGGADAKERFEQLLQQESNRAAPSALPARGLLAIVEACANERIVREVETYLRNWRLERPEQSRLLLETVRTLDPSAARALTSKMPDLQ